MSKGENNRFKWPIIGHYNQISFLQNNLQNDSISHAYLFVGPENIGKTAVANFLVNSLICRHLNNQKISLVPCGECECCKQLNNKIHPDVYWLEREMGENGKLNKNIGVDQIRNLLDKLSLRSFLNSYKVGVIDQAQSLNSASANSLLKTLEEPSPKTVIILLANSLAGLPPTIASRCQVIRFSPVSNRVIEDYLVNIGADRKKAKKLAALSFGRPGLAIKYFSDPDFYEDNKNQIRQFIDLVKTDMNSRFKIVSHLVDSNDLDGVKSELTLWQKILRDVMLINFSESLVAHQGFLTDFKELSQRYSIQEVTQYISEINHAKHYLDANANPRLVLENLAINF